MTGISYHRTVNDLQELGLQSAGPFARLEWFALLEAAGAEPVVALARDGEHAVALPLMRTPAGLGPLTNWYAFSFAELTTPAAPPALLAALARDLAGQAARIELARLPEDALHRLDGAFRGAGWLTLAEPCDTNHILRLGGRDYAAFLADRPGALRTTLKRKAKKVGVTLSTRFDPAQWAAYEAIYAQSWKPAEGDPAMLRAFAQSESAAGHYRLALAHHEGAAVAAQFWTAEGDTAFIHKLAHRPDANALSPGTTLSAALFAHVIDHDKVQLVDFGTGDDPYKRDWMEEVRIRYRLTCLRPAARNLPAMARAALRKLVSQRPHG